MKILNHQRDPQEWREFLDLLRQAVAEDKLEPFFASFLTMDERDSLGLRVRIVSELLKGDSSQREMQQSLNTSAATITRGSNMLKTLEPTFLEWLNGKLVDKD